MKAFTQATITGRIFSRNILCVLMLIVLVENSFGQLRWSRIDILKLKKTEYEKYLYPPVKTPNATQVVLFMMYPEVEPNASFRIIDIGKESYLEVRYLEKNIWQELFPRIHGNRCDSMSLKTHFCSIPVSKLFRNKMVDVFLSIKKLNGEEVNLYNEGRLYTYKPDVFDGSTYEFRININGKMESTVIQVEEKDAYNTQCSEITDFTYKVKLTNVRIINDVKNDAFKEPQYDIYR